MRLSQLIMKCKPRTQSVTEILAHTHTHSVEGPIDLSFTFAARETFQERQRS